MLVRVSSSVSTVRLADDPRTIIGARLETSRALGTISGSDSTSQLAFTLYDPSLPVKAGERVVTYGSAAYAGGVPIGVTVGSGDIGTSPQAGSLTQQVQVKPVRALRHARSGRRRRRREGGQVTLIAPGGAAHRDRRRPAASHAPDGRRRCIGLALAPTAGRAAGDARRPRSG